MAWIRFSNLRLLQQGKRSNQGHTMMLHTYISSQCPYQVSSSYTLWFLRYSPVKLFPTTHPPTMGENNIRTALKGCGVKLVVEEVLCACNLIWPNCSSAKYSLIFMIVNHCDFVTKHKIAILTSIDTLNDI